MKTVKQIAAEKGLGIETVRRLARAMPDGDRIGNAHIFDARRTKEIFRRISQYKEAKRLIRELTGREGHEC
jgi:hypothetical protein